MVSLTSPAIVPATTGENQNNSSSSSQEINEEDSESQESPPFGSGQNSPPHGLNFVAEYAQPNLSPERMQNFFPLGGTALDHTTSRLVSPEIEQNNVVSPPPAPSRRSFGPAPLMLSGTRGGEPSGADRVAEQARPDDERPPPADPTRRIPRGSPTSLPQHGGDIAITRTFSMQNHSTTHSSTRTISSEHHDQRQHDENVPVLSVDEENQQIRPRSRSASLGFFDFTSGSEIFRSTTATVFEERERERVEDESERVEDRLEERFLRVEERFSRNERVEDESGNGNDGSGNPAADGARTSSVGDHPIVQGREQHDELGGQQEFSFTTVSSREDEVNPQGGSLHPQGGTTMQEETGTAGAPAPALPALPARTGDESTLVRGASHVTERTESSDEYVVHFQSVMTRVGKLGSHEDTETVEDAEDPADGEKSATSAPNGAALEVMPLSAGEEGAKSSISGSSTTTAGQAESSSQSSGHTVGAPEGGRKHLPATSSSAASAENNNELARKKEGKTSSSRSSGSSTEDRRRKRELRRHRSLQRYHSVPSSGDEFSTAKTVRSRGKQSSSSRAGNYGANVRGIPACSSEDAVDRPLITACRSTATALGTTAASTALAPPSAPAATTENVPPTTRASSITTAQPPSFGQTPPEYGATSIVVHHEESPLSGFPPSEEGTAGTPGEVHLASPPEPLPFVPRPRSRFLNDLDFLSQQLGVPPLTTPVVVDASRPAGDDPPHSAGPRLRTRRSRNLVRHETGESAHETLLNANSEVVPSHPGSEVGRESGIRYCLGIVWFQQQRRETGGGVEGCGCAGGGGEERSGDEWWRGDEGMRRGEERGERT